ncbi:peptidoglycan-binding domain-containing protein [Pontivivens nitratireducens]|uniref:Peptidoglycan-binding protein n=1 Tax=Pontivivens nitratireducens TaxID=2758038 RepID=A0A6G7VMZ9_9RHOB|nr:peptidoglycan-binding domain-containing protein [Pontibrevibacter nitratireducens]QIK41290.1 peptidoglycan-binding protein [Pontibrevibacter nitratireducens]
MKITRITLLFGTSLLVMACDMPLPQAVADPGEAQPVSPNAAADLSGFASTAPLSTSGPENALPGQCYTQVTRPARFETETRQVLETPASAEFEVIPATYRTETVPVVVEEAYTRVDLIPAVYETVMDTVIVEPSREVTCTIPAEYTTVAEQVPVRPSYRNWVASNRFYPTGTSALGGTVIGNRTLASGAVETLVEFPPEFETVSRRELVQPERTVEVVVPAVTRQVEREVVATNERVIRKEVPATFREVSTPVQVLSAWANVVCDRDYNPTLVRALQRALAEQGEYPGAVDGIMGPGTRRELRAYQLDLGYDTPALKLEAVRALRLTA